MDALYRRLGAADDSSDDEIESGPFVLNKRNRTLDKNGERVKLTQTEYSLIKLFMENPGRALSREDILENVWGADYNGELKIVDVNIRRLRMKVEDTPTVPSTSPPSGATATIGGAEHGGEPRSLPPRAGGAPAEPPAAGEPAGHPARAQGGLAGRQLRLRAAGGRRAHLRPLRRVRLAAALGGGAVLLLLASNLWFRERVTSPILGLGGHRPAHCRGQLRLPGGEVPRRRGGAR